MPKVQGGFTYALQRMDEINAAKAKIADAIKRGQRKQQVACCDWAPVGEIKNPPVKKPEVAPYFADWTYRNVPSETSKVPYTSPFAPTGN